MSQKSIDPQWAIVCASDGRIVANVNSETGPDLPPLVSTKMPQKANARLIAAAPDLLAMLKTVTEELEEEVNDTYRCYSLGCNGAMHPAYVGRYERDMSSVRRAQALIAAIEGAEVTP